MDQVGEAAGKRVLFLPHAINQMNRADRMIEPEEVEAVIMKGEVVEDYPDDDRGHSCLLLGHGEGGRPLHVVCAPKAKYLAIITAYFPDPQKWSADFKRRI